MAKFLKKKENTTAILLLIFFIIVIIVVIISFLYRKKKVEKRTTKKIWTYWHDKELPQIIQLCFQTWKKHNPGYEFIVLNKENYRSYIKSLPDDIANHPNFNDNHARFADLLRLFVISEHGGVWADASILCTQPLDEWVDENAQFTGFYLDGWTVNKDYPVIESWFFASTPDCEFMRRWRDEFVELKNFASADDYFQNRKDMGVDFQNIVNSSYFCIHVAAQKVLQIDKVPIDKKTMHIQTAESGPYKFVKDFDWNVDEGLSAACRNPSNYKPMMKLNGDFRKHFVNNFDKYSNDVCKWV